MNLDWVTEDTNMGLARPAHLGRLPALLCQANLAPHQGKGSASRLRARVRVLCAPQPRALCSEHPENCTCNTGITCSSIS